MPTPPPCEVSLSSRRAEGHVSGRPQPPVDSPHTPIFEEYDPSSPGPPHDRQRRLRVTCLRPAAYRYRTPAANAIAMIVIPPPAIGATRSGAPCSFIGGASTQSARCAIPIDSSNLPAADGARRSGTYRSPLQGPSTGRDPRLSPAQMVDAAASVLWAPLSRGSRPPVDRPWVDHPANAGPRTAWRRRVLPRVRWQRRPTPAPTSRRYSW